MKNGVKFEAETIETKAIEEPVEAEKVEPMTLMEKAKQFCREHALEIAMYGMTGLAALGCGIVGYRQYKANKAFDQEIKARFGLNVVHTNFLGGSVSKREADLKIWEEGEGKKNFDKVLAFAKTLSLGDDEDFYIERCLRPDGHGDCISVTQMRSNYTHGEWF